jgi:hypothetical protein
LGKEQEQEKLFTVDFFYFLSNSMVSTFQLKEPPMVLTNIMENMFKKQQCCPFTNT